MMNETNADSEPQIKRSKPLRRLRSEDSSGSSSSSFYLKYSRQVFGKSLDADSAELTRRNTRQPSADIKTDVDRFVKEHKKAQLEREECAEMDTKTEQDPEERSIKQEIKAEEHPEGVSVKEERHVERDPEGASVQEELQMELDPEGEPVREEGSEMEDDPEGGSQAKHEPEELKDSGCEQMDSQETEMASQTVDDNFQHRDIESLSTETVASHYDEPEEEAESPVYVSEATIQLSRTTENVTGSVRLIVLSSAELEEYRKNSVRTERDLERENN